jgi:hypothetical protein
LKDSVDTVFGRHSNKFNFEKTTYEGDACNTEDLKFKDMVKGSTLSSKCEDESENTESPVVVTKKWVR